MSNQIEYFLYITKEVCAFYTLITLVIRKKYSFWFDMNFDVRFVSDSPV